MYRYGPAEGFQTPTTAGSEHAGAPVVKSSRALFDSKRDCRPSEALPHGKQASGRPEHPDHTAKGNWLGDVTKEDLQELWRHTSIFPLITGAGSAEQPNGCEQEQQLACLAQLLKDKACRDNAVHPQAHLHAAMQSAYLPTAGTLPRFAHSNQNDSAAANYAAGPGHRGVSVWPGPHASATQASASLYSETDAQHQPAPDISSQTATDARSSSHAVNSNDASRRWQQPLSRHIYEVSRFSNQFPNGGAQSYTHQQEGSSQHTHQQQFLSGLHPQARIPFTGRQPNLGRQTTSEHADDSNADLHHALSSQLLMHSFINPAPQALPGTMQDCQHARAYLQAMAAQQCQEQPWATQCSPQLTGPVQHRSADSGAMQDSPQPAIPAQHGSRVARASWPSPVLPDNAGHRSGLAPGAEQTAEGSPLQCILSVHANQFDKDFGQSEQHASIRRPQAVSDTRQAAAAIAPPPRTSHRLGLKRKQAALSASKADPPSADCVGFDSKQADLDAEEDAQARQTPEAAVAPEVDQAPPPSGATSMSPNLSAVEDVDSPANQHGTSEASAKSLRRSNASEGKSHSAGSSQIDSSTSQAADRDSVSHTGLSTCMEEVDLSTDPADALDVSPKRLQIPDDLSGLQDYLGQLQDELPPDPAQGLAMPSWNDLLKEAAGQLTPQGFPRSAPAIAVRPTFSWIDHPSAKRQRTDADLVMWDSGMHMGQHRFPPPSQNPHLSMAPNSNSLLQYVNGGSSSAQQHRQTHASRNMDRTAARSAGTADHSHGTDHLASEWTDSAANAQSWAHNPTAPAQHGTMTSTKQDKQHSALHGHTAVQGQAACHDRQQHSAGSVSVKHGTGQVQGPPLGQVVLAQQSRAQDSSARQGQTAGLCHAKPPPAAKRSQSASQGRGQKCVRGQNKGQLQTAQHHTGSLGKVSPFAMVKGSAMEGELNDLNNRIQATVLQLSGGNHAAEVDRTASKFPDASTSTRPLNKPLSLVESKGSLILQSDDAQTNGSAAAAKAGAKHARSASSNGLIRIVQNGSGKPCGTGNVQLVKLSGTTQVGLPA